MLSFARRYPKLSILSATIMGILFLGWLGWYVSTFLRLQREAVLRVASQALSCPKEQINIGYSHQFNDGPSEIPVKGCGRSGLVLCDERSSTAGLLKQYFIFNLSCRMRH